MSTGWPPFRSRFSTTLHGGSCLPISATRVCIGPEVLPYGQSNSAPRGTVSVPFFSECNIPVT